MIDGIGFDLPPDRMSVLILTYVGAGGVHELAIEATSRLIEMIDIGLKKCRMT